MENLPAEVQGMRGLVAAAHQTPSIQAGQSYLKFIQEPPDGAWVYGKENVEPEEGSTWAINPNMLTWGWILWRKDGGQPAKAVSAVVRGPMPPQDELPPKNHEKDQIKELRGMTLVCLDGEDEGVQVTWETDSMGGHDVWNEILHHVGQRLESGRADCFPVVTFSTGQSYTAHGKTIYKPALKLVGWTDQDGTPAPEQLESPEQEEAETPAAEQPGTGAGRRTRRAAKTETAEAEAAAPAKPVRRRRRRRSA